MKSLKILNLNLWNYNNWGERKPKIIGFIRKHNPDIVVLQEIRDDVRFNKKGENQAKQLTKELGYPYYSFYAVSDKRKERPEQYNKYCIEGTAIISKFPILKTKKSMLKKHPTDRYSCGNLYAQLKIKNKKVDLLGVHFSNSELTSLLHLIETLKKLGDEKINPIIVGDFNMFDFELLKDLTKENFISSRSFKKYISYPARRWALDYILIPRQFKFKSFECTGEGLSDHKALVAEIKI